MLKLIYGVSGSGKTSEIMNRIRSDIQNKKRCFLLVPEQQAYISEFDVPRLLPRDARLYFEVVHFSGLAEKIFHCYGGMVGSSLQGGMKTLLMWDTLRSLAPLLEQYRQNAAQDASLIALMQQTVNELRMNGVDPETLEKIANQLPTENPLKSKLRDLALISATYTQKMEQNMSSDLPDKLLRMAKTLENHAFFADSNVYIDSFTSFTMQEYRVLREILRQANEVTVALCADGFSSKLPHFQPTVQTGLRLLHLASDVNVSVKKEQLYPHNSQKPIALSVLEKDLWRFDVKKEECAVLTSEDKNAVQLTVCPNLYEEAEAAALNILELVQQGLCYGDITVVVRDIDTYRGVLDAALERYHIPFFLSERTDLLSKPLARLILSALRAVIYHYPTQDVLTLVKTGLTGVHFSDTSMFEEYCETWHIRGSRFTEATWSMNPDGLTTERSPRGEAILAAANRTRKKVIDPLERFSAAMRQSAKLSDRCRALYEYLCDLDISHQMAERAKQELQEGQSRQAGETLRLYRFVTDSLTTLCTAFPDTELTADEFLLVLTLLFSEVDMGSVPNMHDCVIVGSADTLRVENIKASLLLGLCEGEFPAAVSDNGVLSENDKIFLEKNFGLVLDSGEHTRSAEELLYVYRAMTKPTQKLILSTVSTQIDGSPRTPSLAFTRVAFLLDIAKPQVFDLDEIKAAQGRLAPSVSPQLSPLPQKGEPETLYLSHTKLQTFLQCPYRYYSTYRLHLREPKDSRPGYADDGLFLHYVFEHFLKGALCEDGSLRIPAEDEISILADQIIEKYLACVCPISPEHADRHLLHLFARLRKLALLILKDILSELQSSRFVPSRFEQIIGMAGENGLPAPVIVLKDGSRVLLSGKVDRVDLYDSGNGLYVRVVDYKSGKHEFKLENVTSGLDIQLVLYLFAALSPDREKLHPAGSQFLYAQSTKGELNIQRSGFCLNDPDVLAAWESNENTYTRGLKKQTVEEICQLENEMKNAVSAAAERILSGSVEKTPSEDACKFCPVRNLCDRAYRK